MKTFLTLDAFGVVLAIVFGVLIFYFGGNYGLFFLAVILFFLVASAFVTEFRKDEKKAMRLYERARGWKNVFANGIVPLLAAALYYYNGVASLNIPANVIIIAYVASVAGATADKFSSEVGVLFGRPRMLLSMKEVKPGVSGGVSAVGFIVGLLGSYLISMSLMQFGIEIILLSAAAGLIGDTFDSVFGFFEEKGIGNKYTSNIACAITAAAFAALVYVAL